MKVRDARFEVEIRGAAMGEDRGFLRLSLELHCRSSPNGAHVRVSLHLRVKVQSLGRHDPSYASARGPVGESGVPHGLFRGRLLPWNE